MRPFKLIIGIGLPRTGTSSLAAALNILGYSGKHSCVIFGEKDTVKKNNKEYFINNSSFKDIDFIISNNLDAKFILTTRDDLAWKESIKNFSLDDISVCPSVFEEKILKLFKEKDLSNLLIIDFEKNNNMLNWTKLCDFLEEVVPSKNFPKIKNLIT